MRFSYFIVIMESFYKENSFNKFKYEDINLKKMSKRLRR